VGEHLFLPKAIGRQTTMTDMSDIHKIITDWQNESYKISSVLSGCIESEQLAPFRATSDLSDITQ
jgi:hypothetical protein